MHGAYFHQYKLLYNSNVAAATAAATVQAKGCRYVRQGKQGQVRCKGKPEYSSSIRKMFA